MAFMTKPSFRPIRVKERNAKVIKTGNPNRVPRDVTTDSAGRPDFRAEHHFRCDPSKLVGRRLPLDRRLIVIKSEHKLQIWNLEPFYKAVPIDCPQELQHLLPIAPTLPHSLVKREGRYLRLLLYEMRSVKFLNAFVNKATIAALLKDKAGDPYNVVNELFWIALFAVILTACFAWS